MKQKNIENMGFKIPSKELPEKGKRVNVICKKEMIYTGNSDSIGSDWIDDGNGDRSILFWHEIRSEK